MVSLVKRLKREAGYEAGAAVGDTAGAVPGTLAIALDIAIVNVALPGLITDLHAPLDEAPWMVNGLPAGVTGCLPVSCALLIVASGPGELFGPRSRQPTSAGAER